jgi:hypothetical protein
MDPIKMVMTGKLFMALFYPQKTMTCNVGTINHEFGNGTGMVNGSYKKGDDWGVVLWHCLKPTENDVFYPQKTMNERGKRDSGDS